MQDRTTIPRDLGWAGPHTEVVAADPCGRTNAPLVSAARRADGVGILDVADEAALRSATADLARRRVASFWVRPSGGLTPGAAAALGPDLVPVVVVTAEIDGPDVAQRISDWAAPGRRIVAQVTSREEARAAVEAGADGLIASGCEAGGRVGTTEAFILFQQVVELGVPVWVRGGIGKHTASAVVAGGGAGVVLDVQLGLAREGGLGPLARRALETMDGSETRVVGGHRFYTRPDLHSAGIGEGASPARVASMIGEDPRTDLLPFGQDGGFAVGLAAEHVTVGGIVGAVRAAIAEHLAAAADEAPLAPGAGVSGPHGTRYPIAQGPMTRVSDRAAFAASVAEGGGLPFLALALLPAAEVRDLLTETAERLGDRPWGVGVLGFVPAELRAEQLEVVHEIAPPVALIAGGRPSQAAPLEAAGIATYLHVPSPGLLDRFLKDGARKFVFEGRECGGHVGPRSSFALWDAQIERLMAVDDPENLQVLLAGGVHDALSGAMAAAALAPLAAKGAKVGVLMGTAYLFTEEAVTGGAIRPAFQEVAVDCDTTVLLETAPGHATRCVETDFVRAFAARRDELVAEGVEASDRWAELETLNLGRLRIASKGLVRGDTGIEEVNEGRQRAEGMYMIGEVATLRHAVTTIADLHEEVSGGSAALAAAPASRIEVHEPERAQPLDIAIVGMDAFFPGAVGAQEFWAEIVAGTDAVTEVLPERWDVDRYYDADAFTRDAGRKTPSKWGGFIRRIGFDPFKYGIPPASLAAIEPVQLLSLEVAARALADAGYATRPFNRERASVVFGSESGNELGGAYGVRAFLPQLFGGIPEAMESWLPSLTEDSFPGVLANVIAGRIANRLDLGGVNYTVDAACASSLAALDAACKELSTGQSDLVLAGGADLHNGLNDYLMFASVHALSPSGRCRTFDASADGIALGEGIACVVLKRLADAERDGDRIYAVIDAVAGSSDGRSLGLTAPRKEGQQRAVHRALARSGREAVEIGLVEAHGTGTVVGDRTEMATLTEVFAEAGVEPGAVVLGSVKSQIGHTKCAAGLAGLMKVALSIHHAVLPPTINLVDPNPYYDASSSPFRFLDQARPWASETRRAAVSAFGFGGTNFHALLSSYDAGDRPAHGLTQWPAELFLIRSASPADAVQTAGLLASTVASIMAADPDGQRHALRDLAATVSSSGSGPVQIAIVAESLSDLHDGLEQARTGAADPRQGVFLAREVDPGSADSTSSEVGPTVAFLYPGQGSQRPGMLADLFVGFGGLDDILRSGERWADRLFPPAAFTREEKAAQVDAITATDVAQPTLGMASLALTRLLRRLGVEPAMAGGHSYGELAALAAAGSFDDATLLEISAARGGSILEAIERSGGDPGTMAALSLTSDEVGERLGAWPALVLANHNGPRQAVISGPTEAVREAVAALEADGVKAKLLPVACAFHSPLIAEAGSLLAERLAEHTVRSPEFPVWSNVTAEPYPAGDDAAVNRLLTDQVTAGVRFVEQIESMYAAGARVFVEAGPGRVLTQQVAKILGDRPHAMVACDVAGEPGLRRLLLAVAELATLGVPVDATALFEGRARTVDLRSLPVATPGWLVDGAFVRTADGSPLTNSLQPADQLPTLDFGGPSMATGSDDASGVVLEYLRSVRQIVAAERDVMMRYLGSAVPASASFDDFAGYIEGSEARPAVAASSVAAQAVEASSVAGHEGAPATAVADRPALSGADLLREVQAIVSERTGYPVEMLDPDLDLEADLSIDSIKRIEIVGELAERIGLAGLDESAVDEELVEELAQHKSLRAIVEWIEGMASGDPSLESAAASAVAHAAHEPEHHDLPLPEVSQRFEIHEELLAPPVAIGDLSGAALGVIAGHVDLTGAVAGAAERRGATVTVIERGDRSDDRAALLGGLHAVIDLSATAGDPAVDARSVFADLQPALLGSARRALAVAVPLHADGTPTGVAGLMRSLARERHDALVRAIEIDPAGLAEDPSRFAEIVVDELLDLDAPAAVSWVGGQRTARVVGDPVDVGAPAPLALDADAVVVITGGARGITARVAEGLARANPCKLVLVGRSALPDGEEDVRTAGALDRAELRRCLLEIGELRTPAEIEAACNRIEADREMRTTIEALAGLCPEVEYVSLDVRAPEFGALLDEVRSRHGRLDGVIHGAGVLDDHFIRDKSMEGFDRVYGTKVDGARAVLSRLDGMRFVALFGSVSGVFGNRGQVDYSAANDALDTLARSSDGRNGCHVVSVDWGPWGGGGMVSAELEREYARRGIGLVDPDDGVRALLNEIASPSGPSQVVVMRGAPEAFAPPVEHTPASDDLVGGFTTGD